MIADKYKLRSYPSHPHIYSSESTHIQRGSIYQIFSTA
jgi:hypothetical protein